jgi:hypothetical protein
MKRWLVVALALAATSVCADDLALPDGLAYDRDLRGTYRAALCGRADMPANACARALRKYGGEVQAPRPPAADPARYRLLFAPGFLAACFPGVHTFGDVVEAARKQGYAAQVLATGGRNNVAANARLIAEQIDRLPPDNRRLILVGHSKGAIDLLTVLAARPDIAARTVGVLTVAGALLGTPLADALYGAYGVTLGAFPFSSCARGEGDAVADLSPRTRRDWWNQVGSTLRTPVYSLVTLPDLERLSPTLVASFAGLSRLSANNDGVLLVRDQVAPGVQLLGIVNVDHLGAAIPYPGDAFVFVTNAMSFPRPQVVLAAVDVIASQPEK